MAVGESLESSEKEKENKINLQDKGAVLCLLVTEY